MITQPLAHRTAQPALSDTGHGSHTHRALLKRPYLHAVPQETTSLAAQTPNVALSGLQFVIGYEWLLAGGDKLLLGSFPAQLGELLNSSLSAGHLPGFFTALLRGLVVPNATLFGYLIEWGETLAGLGLIAACLVTVLRPLAERFLSGTSARFFGYGDWLLTRLAPIAATGAGLLGLSFFFLDGMPVPWFVPSVAYGGSIDTGLFLAAASVVLVVSQLLQQRAGR